MTTTRTWAGRALLASGTAGALAGTLHSIVNGRLLRRPSSPSTPCEERVSVLIPARDEARQIGDCLRAVLAQTGVPELEVLVLDDSSEDGTAAVVQSFAETDHRVRLLSGEELPAGWLGKPFACSQLATQASGSILVFLDADVRLTPEAVSASVALLRGAGLDLVSPYPRQIAITTTERLVQPLLQWSWLTTLPLRVAERSARPSLTAANGQLLVVSSETYRRCGGHAAGRHEVLDDLALARAVKAIGGRATVADGTTLASCRMYESWPGLREGYTKSLWAASGSPTAAAGVVGLLGLCYVVPTVAALRGSRIGLIGYAAGVAGRVVTARRTGGRAFPDALAHPASVLLLGGLTVASWRGHRRGQLTWRGRSLAGSRKSA